MKKLLIAITMILSTSAFAELSPNDPTGCILDRTAAPVLTNQCVAVSNSTNGYKYMRCIGGSQWSGSTDGAGCTNLGNLAPPIPLYVFMQKTHKPER